jgi:hypothetical protein
MPETPASVVYRGMVLPRRAMRFASQIGLILIAASLILVAAYRLTQLWLVPEVTVGITQTEPEINTLLSELARVTRPSSLKIRIAPAYRDQATLAAALEEGRIDFAVIRPDQTLPRNGLTAAIVREDPIVLMVLSQPAIAVKSDTKQGKPGNSADKEDVVSQLSKKRIGLVSASEADHAALRRVLAFQEVSEDLLVPMGFTAADVRSEVAGKKVEVIAVIGPLGAIRRLTAALSDLRPVVLPINAAGIAAEMPVFGQTTIAARSLAAGIPAEDVQVTSVSWRLVARKDVERATVSELLQALFAHRLELTRATELAWQIKGLEDDGATFAKLPNHRGALDYYNREQQTFMDLYGDWLWLGLFAAGGVSSGLAWLVQLLSRRRKQLVESILDRLLEILSEARAANTVKRLDELTIEVDGLVTHAIRQARWRATDPTSTTALTLAIDSSRAAIADRRAFFLRQGGHTPVSALRGSN